MNKLVEMVTINSATILYYSSLLNCLVKIVTLQCNGHSHSLCLGLYSHLGHPGGDNEDYVDDDDGYGDDDNDDDNLEDFFAEKHLAVHKDSSQLSELGKSYLFVDELTT